jgi:hypothetical protein
VIIYLGESMVTGDLAIDFILDCDYPASENALAFPKTVELLQTLTEFFCLPWFHRVWVLQEVSFARTAVVMCAAKSFDWAVVQHFRS